MDDNEIVKRHHGLVWIESTKGAGSTFWWNLPLRADEKIVLPSALAHHH
jgi:signal transduction histidine kinase